MMASDDTCWIFVMISKTKYLKNNLKSAFLHEKHLKLLYPNILIFKKIKYHILQHA